eukprot:TRINITY_DN1837_c0_g1_i1.p1 TRINITY_DN1837_c0_g1~~TRINITY_DN1837_c0_g1_i1.p1  ORF type:complete len:182 (+),score=40.27 TRINITY_DN1837_c0_g1_i1:69-548(+)
MSRKDEDAVSPYVDTGCEEERYVWTQTKAELVIKIAVPKGTRGKDIESKMDNQYLRLAVKGDKTPLIEGQLHGVVQTDVSTWTVDSSSGELEVTLVKATKAWWPGCIVGAQTIDVSHIDGARYIDDSLLMRLQREKRQAEKERKEKAAAERAAASAASS